MARKKADEARDAAESGEDSSAVLTDDRSDDTTSTSTVDEDGTRRDDGDDDATDSGSTTVAAGSTAADDDIDDDIDDLDDDDDYEDGVGRPAFFATLGVAVVAVLGVLFLLGAFVWPAFLGPGAPEDTANRSVSALGAKDAGQLGELSCVRLDGQPAAAFPPELLALIGNAAPAGPPVQTLDTEARAPIDLTLTQGGQSQTLPADLLFGVSDGGWCLNGISQRQ